MESLKGFAVDVDGTLTDYGGLLNLDAAFVLRKMESLGLKVVLVSGRGTWDVYALSTFLGTTRTAVAENGGVVAYSPTEVVILGDVSPCLEAYDLLSRKFDGVKLKPVFPRLTEVVLLRTFDLDRGRRLIHESGLPVAIWDSTFAYHLTDASVNKAVGLKVALKHLGLPPSDMVAIGDSDTDIPMFEVCGYSIALGNAPQTTKDKASHIVPTPMGDGLVDAVQHVVEKFMLGGFKGL